MRKFGITLMVCVLVLALGALPVKTRYGKAVIAANESVQLNEVQQKELATLHEDILEKKKEVISK
ncbi:MAG: hypothetical protein AB1394_17365, partial [Bacteroidota bacterium]